jgi:hypothetical protein
MLSQYLRGIRRDIVVANAGGGKGAQTVTRRPDADPDEPEPPGGHAAERLRQFQQARGSSGPPEVPAESHDGNGDDDPHPAVGESGSSAAGQPCDGDEDQDDERAVPPPTSDG